MQVSIKIISSGKNDQKGLDNDKQTVKATSLGGNVELPHYAWLTVLNSKRNINVPWSHFRSVC